MKERIEEKLKENIERILSKEELLPTDVANITGLITNKNKNSICLLANIIPQKNNEYKKKPPTITAIIQFLEYL